jgi:hypothetical protein
MIAAAALALAAIGAVLLLGGDWWRARERIRKRHLGSLAREARPATLAVSDDGEHYAFVVRDGDEERVVSDRGDGPPFRHCERPQFSPDHRLFYWATRAGAAGEETVLVADGRVVATPYARAGLLVFSMVGGRWATVGTVEADGAGVVFVDGTEAAHGAGVSVPSFSPDGRHVATLTHDAGGHVVQLVVDGTPRATYEVGPGTCAHAIGETPLSILLTVRYLADGSLLVVAPDADGWAVHRDDRRVASYAGVSPPDGSTPAEETCRGQALVAPSSLAAAKEAAVAAWWERPPGDDARWRVVIDGRPADDALCMRWWSDQPPEFSADGRRWAYPCAEPPIGGTVSMVLGGRRVGEYADVWGVAPADTGSRVAWGASDGAPERPWAFVVDGSAVPGRYDAVWRPRLAGPDSPLAWEAMPERDGRGVLGLDGRRLASFDEVLWGPTFSGSPPSRVSWVIRRGRKISRLDVPLPRR